MQPGLDLRAWMIGPEQELQRPRILGLNQATNVLGASASRRLTYPEPPEVGAVARTERHVGTRNRIAYVPIQRTLGKFYFSFRPSDDERQSLSRGDRGGGLSNLDYMSEAIHLLLSGPPRVCKLLGGGPGRDAHRAGSGGISRPGLQVVRGPAQGPVRT